MLYDNDSVRGLEALERARLGSVGDCEIGVYRCEESGCGKEIYVDYDSYYTIGGDILCEDCAVKWFKSCGHNI